MLEPFTKSLPPRYIGFHETVFCRISQQAKGTITELWRTILQVKKDSGIQRFNPSQNHRERDSKSLGMDCLYVLQTVLCNHYFFYNHLI